MKQTTLLISLLIALALPAAAQNTVVTGTIYETAVVSGSVVTRLSNQYITLKEVQRAGSIVLRRDVSVKLTNGTFSMTVPRSNFTAGDTTKIRMYAPAAPLDSLGIEGVWLIVPDAATADLNSMSRTRVYGPPGFALLVPRLLAGTAGDLHALDTLVFEGGATVVSSFGTLTVTIAATVPYGDSIRIADSIARVARDSAIASLDSARTIRNRLEARISELQTQLDTAGAATRAAIEGDIAKLRDSLVVHRGRIDLLEAAVAGKQAQLSVAQLARIDSALAAGLRVVITSYGNIRVISFDTTGLMLGDMLNGANQAIAARLGIADSVTTYVTAWQHKLVSDTLDSWRSKIWAPAGGSNWTVDAGGVYRDSPVTIGQAAVDKRAALFVDGNIQQSSIDSTSRLGHVVATSIRVDTLHTYELDSLNITVTGGFGPIFPRGKVVSESGYSYGYLDYTIVVDYNNTLTDFYMVGDSTNGVRLVSLTLTRDGARGFGAGYSRPEDKVYLSNAGTAYNTPNLKWTVNNSYYSAGVLYVNQTEGFFASAAPIGVSWALIRVALGSGGIWRCHAVYAVPASTPSATPVRFANN